MPLAGPPRLRPWTGPAVGYKPRRRLGAGCRFRLAWLHTEVSSDAALGRRPGAVGASGYGGQAISGTKDPDSRSTHTDSEPSVSRTAYHLSMHSQTSLNPPANQGLKVASPRPCGTPTSLSEPRTCPGRQPQLPVRMQQVQPVSQGKERLAEGSRMRGPGVTGCRHPQTVSRRDSLVHADPHIGR